MSAFLQSQRLPAPVRITDQIWPEGTMPVVSVFCITYNHVNFIRDAIEGFLMQETTFPVEIFIHDDASTDGTAQIVKEYAEKYPNLFWTVLQTENQWSKGNPNAYFFGLMEKQRGEFIALCEGDDYWIAKEKLQKQVEVLEANPEASLVFHNSWVKHQESRRDRFFNAGIDKNEFTLVDVIERGWFISTNSMLYRSEVQPDENLLKISFGGDIVIITAAAMLGKLLYLDHVWSVYNIHNGGASSQFSKSKENLYCKLYPNYILYNYILSRQLKEKILVEKCWQKISNLIGEVIRFFVTESGKCCYPIKEIEDKVVNLLKIKLSNYFGGSYLSDDPQIINLIDKHSSEFTLHSYMEEVTEVAKMGLSFKFVKVIFCRRSLGKKFMLSSCKNALFQTIKK